MITPGTARFFSKGEGAPPQMRPVPFYIWLAQPASGVKGGDAEASPPGPQAPCEKNLGRGDGAEKLYGAWNSADKLRSGT